MLMANKKYPEPTVGALILNGKGEILLAKSRKWSSLYIMPGGHIEIGETIEEALKREVKEEVGVEIEVLKFVAHVEGIFPKNFHERKHFIFLTYLCRLKSGTAKPDGRELQELIWIKPEDALKMKGIEEFTRMKIGRYLKGLK
jgi:nucleoside triphosphatase